MLRDVIDAADTNAGVKLGKIMPKSKAIDARLKPLRRSKNRKDFILECPFYILSICL
jgi:hypothetical protein